MRLLVDAAADDLQRLFHRVAGLGAQGDFGQRGGDDAVGRGGDLDIRLLRAGTGRDDDRGFTQDAGHVGGTGGVGDAQRQATFGGGGGEAGVEDPRIGCGGATTRGVDQGFQAFTHHGGGIDLEQQVAAAAQVEAKADLACPVRQHAARQQIGQGYQDAEEADAYDGEHLPAGEIHHGRGPALNRDGAAAGTCSGLAPPGRKMRRGPT
jgi:hypothetical protein